MIKDIIVENENLENITDEDRALKIIDDLRKALIRNIENINILGYKGKIDIRTCVWYYYR